MKLQIRQKSRTLTRWYAVDGPYRHELVPFYSGQQKTIVFTCKGQTGRYCYNRGSAVWEPIK